MKKLYILLVMLASVAGLVCAQDSNQDKDRDVEDIIRKVEKNRVYDGMYAEGSIIVNDKFGEKKTDFVSKSLGADYSLLEYTSTAEKGQKSLRVKNNIYLYYPDAEQVVTLNKSMFQQSLLNSDISYEDLTGDQSILNKFIAELEGEEEKNGVVSYKIYLSAKNDRKETYPYQRIWVSKDTYTLVYQENYTRKKKLRKTVETKKIQKLKNGVYITTEILVKDVLKKGDGTKVIMENIKLQDMNKNDFSVESLKF